MSTLLAEGSHNEAATQRREVPALFGTKQRIERGALGSKYARLVAPMTRRHTIHRRSLLLVGGVALLVASASDLLNAVEAQDAVASAVHGQEDMHEHEQDQMVLIDPAPSAAEDDIGHEMGGDGMMEHGDDEHGDDEHGDDVDEDGDHPNEMEEEDHHTDDEDDHHAAGDDDHDDDALAAVSLVNATSEGASIAQMVHIHEADVYTQSGYDTETIGPHLLDCAQLPEKRFCQSNDGAV